MATDWHVRQIGTAGGGDDRVMPRRSRPARPGDAETLAASRGAPSVADGLRQWVWRLISGDCELVDAAEFDRRLVASYQVMLQITLMAATVYYLVKSVTYYLVDGLTGFLLLGSISLIIAAACAAVARELSKRAIGRRELELRGLAMFLMIYLALVAHQLYHFHAVKLILFMLLALAVATASISHAVTLFSFATCTATVLFFAGEAGSDVRTQYAFVAFAAAVVGFCLTAMTRHSISREISASLVSDWLRAEAEYLADHDMLTGLPNRRQFFRRLNAMLADRDSADAPIGLAIIDLDRFKDVNDTHGHLFGDEVLVQIGHRLAQACDATCFVARVGGDEFAVIVCEAGDPASLVHCGQRICAEIEQPVRVRGYDLQVSASVGMALEETAGSATELLGRADYALSRAKDQEAGIAVFDAEMAAERSTVSAIEQKLRHCDFDAEIHFLYQPQTDVLTGETRGFEALARWDSAEFGPVRPEVFITIAERIGTISKLTESLLRRSLDAARAWPEPLKLSCNLSIRDLESPAAVDAICRIVAESGFPPERIEFEVTETLVMRDYEAARQALARLSALGAHVALDDFGVGYANFGHIDQLHINTVKIDRSFVARLKDSARTARVIKTMIDMCATLELECVVEGAETAEELETLRALGARNVQGFFYGEPMASSEIPAFLARGTMRRMAGAR